ncbi:DUF72 domain-containing protein [uncultured Chryseobacterium sp.]|uniref:DUF72 domain-containing protein n=1 Tax=uncultured Chryseobacterium sp. TaxID=259322 RepID=UPI0025D870AD|nr:DUF72 domain-containing protein [uncultured Chryseobacterium sp.]
MKFGKLEDSSHIDFTLPGDHPDTESILRQNTKGLGRISVGCAKWTRSDLKAFYPKGTKDELKYYATQFNSIELNATFYGMPSPEQIQIWKNKTPPGFTFFPKVPNTISHFRRLTDVTDAVTQFATSVMNFGEQLGTVFLQLHDNFRSQDYARLEKFVRDWPAEIPLAIELRNEEWFADAEAFSKAARLFEQHHITMILVDTAGRRDVLHMRLTTPDAFIRYVATNNETDYERLDDWIRRLTLWKEQGLRNLSFFIHQDIEADSPLLFDYFIRNINSTWKTDLHSPKMATEGTGSLF